MATDGSSSKDAVRPPYARYPHPDPYPILRVSHLDGGALDLALLMPVIGHLGPFRARELAQNTEFIIEIRYPNGATDRFRTWGTGLVSAQRLTIPMEAGKTLLSVWPADDPDGARAYRAGRVVELRSTGRGRR